MRILRSVATGLVLASLGGCFLGGGSLPAIGGQYEGEVTVQGQGIPGSLALEQSGADLTATFAAPSFGLMAKGEGSVQSDGTISLELSYDLQCPGAAELSGSVSPDGRRLEGTIDASDCTGDVTGTFRFER